MRNTQEMLLDIVAVLEQADPKIVLSAHTIVMKMIKRPDVVSLLTEIAKKL